jgi:ribulose-5-phosphate 4-epimerase/fuculose-1-phosphate aldolase
MIDEGYIKYTSYWSEGPPPDARELEALISVRDELWRLGLIGEYPNGIGFGNASHHIAGSREFLISATQTGALGTTSAEHYAQVTDYSIEANWVASTGPQKASSESLTHAMIYELDPEVRCVLHVHNAELWDRWKFKLPTTPADVPYGTPEMARAVTSLNADGALLRERVFIMAGHEDGLTAFGRSPEAAFNSLKTLF